MGKLTRRVFAASILSLACVTSAWAEPLVMSAKDAARRAEAGEIVLIDIRTPKEWEESGVAKGAWPIDMVSKDFASRMQRLLRGESRPIAIICATGGRTLFLQKIIADNGLGAVWDVGEGMYGSRHGRGWLKEGLPVVSRAEALKALPPSYRAAQD